MDISITLNLPLNYIFKNDLNFSTLIILTITVTSWLISNARWRAKQERELFSTITTIYAKIYIFFYCFIVLWKRAICGYKYLCLRKLSEVLLVKWEYAALLNILLLVIYANFHYFWNSFLLYSYVSYIWERDCLKITKLE